MQCLPEYPECSDFLYSMVLRPVISAGYKYIHIHTVGPPLTDISVIKQKYCLARYYNVFW